MSQCPQKVGNLNGQFCGTQADLVRICCVLGLTTFHVTKRLKDT